MCIRDRTEAWYVIVHCNLAPDDVELADLLMAMNNPIVVTLDALIEAAEGRQRHDLAGELRDRKTRRLVPHKMERAGYKLVRNPNAKDSYWVIDGRRHAVYGHRDRPLSELIDAARALSKSAK